MAMIYNLIILAGTVYLVGWQGWSAWWFLLAVILLASGKEEKPTGVKFYD